MDVVLKVTGGPHAGREFVFKEHEVFIVGRGSSAHFRLPAKDRFFSRSHFMIEFNPPLCRLVDLGSRNGTFVNKEKIDQVDLKNGDVIWGGQTRISVVIRGAANGVQTSTPIEDDVADEQVKLSMESFIDDGDGESMLLSLLDDESEFDADYAITASQFIGSEPADDEVEIESVTDVPQIQPLYQDDDGPISLNDSDERIPVYVGADDDEAPIPLADVPDDDDEVSPPDDDGPLPVDFLDDLDDDEPLVVEVPADDDAPLPIHANDEEIVNQSELPSASTSTESAIASPGDGSGKRCLICPNLATGRQADEDQVLSQLCTSCRHQVAEQSQMCPGYRLVKHAGKTKLGDSYLAIQEKHCVPAAVKVIEPEGSDPQEVKRFLREAEILRPLKNPHIARFFDSQTSDGLLFLATEYVVGVPIIESIKQHNKPMSAEQTIKLGSELLSALAYAHSLGVVHRDINPKNVLLVEDGKKTTIKLADFGLARLYESSKLSGLTLTNQFSGTPAFLSPDQIMGFRDSRPTVDQYAAAATLYYMLTRQFVHDFPTNVGKQLSIILHDKVVPLRNRNENIPAALAEVIEKGLAKEPKDRYANMNAFRDALIACAKA